MLGVNVCKIFRTVLVHNMSPHVLRMHILSIIIWALFHLSNEDNNKASFAYPILNIFLFVKSYTHAHTHLLENIIQNIYVCI